MKDIRVLVVDDQRLVREGIVSLLNLQEGITVVASGEDGREGVHLALEHNPDIILMDIRMPVLDGIHAVETLKKNNYPGRIIMLTTFDDHEYISKSLKAGAVGYLMKDIPIADLARAVKQAHGGLYQFAPSVMGSLLSDPAPAGHTGAEDIPETTLSMIEGISEREKDVFKLLGEGLTNGEIAQELSLSEGTVKNYVSGIFNALGLRDRVQAALLAAKWSSR